MEKEQFENPKYVMVHNHAGCPHCGQTHTWDKKDAWLPDDPTQK